MPVLRGVQPVGPRWPVGGVNGALGWPWLCCALPSYRLAWRASRADGTDGSVSYACGGSDKMKAQFQQTSAERPATGGTLLIPSQPCPVLIRGHGIIRLDKSGGAFPIAASAPQCLCRRCCSHCQSCYLSPPMAVHGCHSGCRRKLPTAPWAQACQEAYFASHPSSYIACMPSLMICCALPSRVT